MDAQNTGAAPQTRPVEKVSERRRAADAGDTSAKDWRLRTVARLRWPVMHRRQYKFH